MLLSPRWIQTVQQQCFPFTFKFWISSGNKNKIKKSLCIYIKRISSLSRYHSLNKRLRSRLVNRASRRAVFHPECWALGAWRGPVFPPLSTAMRLIRLGLYRRAIAWPCDRHTFPPYLRPTFNRCQFTTLIPYLGSWPRTLRGELAFVSSCYDGLLLILKQHNGSPCFHFRSGVV